MNTMKILVNILNNHFHLQIKEDKYDRTLTGPEIALNAIEMYQFLMCVENEFNIYFDMEDIKKYGFRTLTDISQMVSKKIL